MSSAVAELENYLQSMLALKPPGVSGSKIQGITALCTANVQVRKRSLISSRVDEMTRLCDEKKPNCQLTSNTE